MPRWPRSEPARRLHDTAQAVIEIQEVIMAASGPGRASDEVRRYQEYQQKQREERERLEREEALAGTPRAAEVDAAADVPPVHDPDEIRPRRPTDPTE